MAASLVVPRAQRLDNDESPSTGEQRRGLISTRRSWPSFVIGAFCVPGRRLSGEGPGALIRRCCRAGVDDRDGARSSASGQQSLLWPGVNRSAEVKRGVLPSGGQPNDGPVLEVSDPIALASVSNVVMMVADARCATRTAVRSAAHEISSPSGRHVVGVLNHTPRTLLRIFSSGLPSGRHGSNAGGHALAPQRQPNDKAVGASRVTIEASDQ